MLKTEVFICAIFFIFQFANRQKHLTQARTKVRSYVLFTPLPVMLDSYCLLTLCKVKM